MKTHRKRHTKENLDVGYYAVGFFDILGQQEHLRAMRSLPEKSNELQMETFIKVLKETYGVVTGTRAMFADFFKSFSKKVSNISALTLEQKKIYRQLDSEPIKINSFSDSIIVFLSLRTDKVKLPTKGVWGIMAAAASTALLSLAAGHPIRGGIDIGLGMEIVKGEIYGPSLSRAYTLESKIAQYPRIVVGKECIDYLQTTASLKPINIYSQAKVDSARKCLELLKVDVDGCVTVDFLGEGFWQSVGYKIEKDIIDMAYQNVIRFHKIFDNKNDKKNTDRYVLLRRYFESYFARCGTLR